MSGSHGASDDERRVREVVGPVVGRHGLTLDGAVEDPRTLTVTWSGPAGSVEVSVDRVDGTVETLVEPSGGGAARSLEELARAMADDDLVRRLTAAAAPGCELGARLAHHAEVLDRTLDR